jgi:F-type H+-transporting ATPase subunit b
MDLTSAQVIGAGLAAIGVGAAAIGVGNVFGSFLESALRNPAAADGQQGRLFIGFAAAELLGLIAIAVAMIILYAPPSAKDGAAAPMPQINQLSEIFFSQLFWLLIVFGIIYFGIARGMVPKVQSTVELREKKIADDLAAAHQAREAAEETEAAYRARIDVSRAEAAALTQEARQASARETETKVRTAAEKIAAKVASAEADIRAAAEAAKAEVDVVAVEAAQEMVARLSGI